MVIDVQHLLIIAFTLGLSSAAFAELNVSYVTLAQTPGYNSQRVYAGQIVPSRVAELGFKMTGRVTQVMVDIGATVLPGQPLAQLDTAELAAHVRSAEANIALAQANIGAMKAEVLLARNTERRFRQLREQGHTPKQTYDETYLNLRIKQSQLTVAKAQLKSTVAAHEAVQVAKADATIAAPFAGTIQARYVDEGSQVNPGEPILRIVEEGLLEAHIGIPGIVGARLVPETSYTVRWNGQTFSALLASVLPEIDPATRTQTAVLNLVDASIPLGSTIELTLNETITESGYWLPLGALTQGDRGLWGVYVINRDNVVNRRLVELIHTEANRVFARGTLADGDRVIDTGVHRIVPGQRVRATESRSVSNAR